MTKHNTQLKQKKLGGGGKKKKGEKKNKTPSDNAEDRRRSYEHHDHCHKVQTKPTHTVPVKPSKDDEIGALLAAEEIEHKKEMREHHHLQHGHHHAPQPGLAH